jgi:predicted HicB family RNase H-like nuclease
MLDPALKRRAAARALADRTSLHTIIEAALRAYLARRTPR